jgi:hypothetical protein
MKIHGQKVPVITPIVVPIIRGEQTIYLKVKPTDWLHFNAVCPEPTPPSVVRAGGEKGFDFADAKYLENKKKYSDAKNAWAFICALSATEDLQWETVNLNKPETWVLWQKELLESGFLQTEINRITLAVFEVNQLDDDKIEQARKSFLASSRSEGKSQ